jgi:hypothetical protein
MNFVTKNKKSSGPRATQKIAARERREAKTQKTGSSSSKTLKRKKIIKHLFLKHFSSFILIILSDSTPLFSAKKWKARNKKILSPKALLYRILFFLTFNTTLFKSTKLGCDTTSTKDDTI